MRERAETREADRVEPADDVGARQELGRHQPGPALRVHLLDEVFAVAPRDRIAHVQHQDLRGERARMRLADLLDGGVRHDERHHVRKGDRLLDGAGLRERSQPGDEILQAIGIARREHHRMAGLDEQRPQRAALPPGADHPDLE